jgi:hypothetical protein
MRTQGCIDLERVIRVRKLTHAAVEQMLGYKGDGNSGIVTRLISGERKMSLEGSLICERELGIPVAHWAQIVEATATGTEG